MKENLLFITPWMKRVLPLAACMLTLFLVSCEEEEDPKPVNTILTPIAVCDLTSPTTWGKDTVVLIDCDFKVNAVLTIKEGAKILFGTNGAMTIGESANGALVVQGTVHKPVVFTSAKEVPQAGDWLGLKFQTKNLVNTTSLKNCVISYAGYNDYPAISLESTKISMDSCLVKASLKTGIQLWTNSAFTKFTNNTLENSGEYLLQGYAQGMLNLGTGNTYTNANNKLIAIEGGEINTTGSLTRQTAPYAVRQSIKVENAELTIEKGAVLKFEPGKALEIGWENYAALIAEGTEEEPILFTSNAQSPQAGDWDGLFFGTANSNTKTSLKYCTFEYGGANTHAWYKGIITINSGIKMDYCTVRHSRNYGVMAVDHGYFVSFTNNSITACEKDPVYIYDSFAHTLGTGNTIEANEGMGIHVYPGNEITKEVTWLLHPVKYILEGNMIIATTTGNAKLTLSEGVTLAFTHGSGIEIGENGALYAKNVRFTSNASSPAKSDWNCIYFGDGTKAGTVLDNCIIEYAGESMEMAIGIYTTNVTVQNCTFQSIGGCAIYIASEDYQPILQNNTFMDNDGEDVLRN